MLTKFLIFALLKQTKDKSFQPNSPTDDTAEHVSMTREIQEGHVSIMEMAGLQTSSGTRCSEVNFRNTAKL